jgi:hypothetical protein
MKLVEGTHYMRRMDQPSSSTYGYTDYMVSVFCALSQVIRRMKRLGGNDYLVIKFVDTKEKVPDKLATSPDLAK